jgi:hypothetical protein
MCSALMRRASMAENCLLLKIENVYVEFDQVYFPLRFVEHDTL